MGARHNVQNVLGVCGICCALGIEYAAMKSGLAQFKGDAVLSLAGYNAGENAVISNDGVPPYEETRAYVPKVVAAWEKARLYCQTLPVHADDGCVFAFDRSFIK